MGVAEAERVKARPRTGSASHRLKLWGFVGAGAAASSVVGAASLAAAYYLREGEIACSTGICSEARPYLALIPFAMLARCIIFLRRAPWRNRRVHGFFDEVSEAITDAALGSIALVVFTFMFRAGFEFRDFSYSRLVFVYDWMLATGGMVVLAIILKKVLVQLRARGQNQRNVVVIGNGSASEIFDELVTRHPELGYQVVGRVRGPQDDGHTNDLAVALTEVARKNRIDELMLAVPRIDRRDLGQLVEVAELAHVEIKAVPELFGLPPTKVTLESVGRIPVLNLLQEPLPGGRRAFKRAMDVTIGGLCLVFAFPAMLLAAIAIATTSNGPILLRQRRIGMDGRPFEMLKFRSMVVDADPTGHEEYVSTLIAEAEPDASEAPGFYKLVDDPRVTPVGRLLRRFSLDELPQLINVVRGEMSLVGPRPALPFEVQRYQDWHRRRLDVRPGMTGLWQVSGRAKLDFQNMVRLDIEYIERWSPLLDLLILIRTIPAILRRETG